MTHGLLGSLLGIARVTLAVHLLLKLGFLFLVVGSVTGSVPHRLTELLGPADRIGWLFVPLGIALFMGTVHRAATELQARGVHAPTLQPGPAALHFLVPLLQLPAGGAILEDLWRHSGPAGESDEPPRFVSSFWQMWVMGAFVCWLGALAQGFPALPYVIALGLLVVGLLMQIHADLQGLRVCAGFARRLRAQGFSSR